ncbi:Histone-lysine N-methyltransferase 2C [Acropora cervicornis]|uniref:Histone-lysine N-methyltransferase 2C n=1 Tax=Acropora cervicornis TaxID=6130 RepID=A0AAD9V5S6_ACRCE|nr:Histone-lysine N-methyltransferase 2C [Acropora cervicornis]
MWYYEKEKKHEKKFELCRKAVSKEKVLVCRRCNKGYHPLCTEPVTDSTEKFSWKCQKCRQCRQCGTQKTSQWHIDYTLCDICYQNKNKGNQCPLCNNEQGDQRVVQCDSCSRKLERDRSIIYVCKLCREEVDKIKKECRREVGTGPVFCFSLTPMKTDNVELEEISPVTSMVLSQMHRGQDSKLLSGMTTSKATTPCSMTWLTSEPVQWSRLRMTYSFEYFIMKQYGKVLL